MYFCQNGTFIHLESSCKLRNSCYRIWPVSYSYLCSSWWCRHKTFASARSRPSPGSPWRSWGPWTGRRSCGHTRPSIWASFYLLWSRNFFSFPETKQNKTIGQLYFLYFFSFHERRTLYTWLMLFSYHTRPSIGASFYLLWSRHFFSFPKTEQSKNNIHLINAILLSRSSKHESL